MWRGGECVRVLEGHEGPVLSLAVLPSGDVLTGSGDTTIRQWAGATNRCVNVFRGHTDSVRYVFVCVFVCVLLCACVCVSGVLRATLYSNTSVCTFWVCQRVLLCVCCVCVCVCVYMQGFGNSR